MSYFSHGSPARLSLSCPLLGLARCLYSFLSFFLYYSSPVYLVVNIEQIRGIDNSLLCRSGGRKSKIKVSSGLVHSRPLSFPLCPLMALPPNKHSWSLFVFVYQSYQSRVLSSRPSFHTCHLFKGSVSNHSHTRG